MFCDLDPELGQPIEQRLGPRTRFVKADVSQEADIANVADVCASAFGPATILVNNAGVNANFDATTMTGDDWDRFMITSGRGHSCTAKAKASRCPSDRSRG